MGKQKTANPFGVPGALLPAAAPAVRDTSSFKPINEETAYGGTKTFDVPGNASNLDSALHADLLPGETIIRQFDVNMSPAISCWKKLMWCLLICCRSCMPKPLYHYKRRLVLTSQARLGFFSANLSGVEAPGCCCIKGNKKAHQHTRIQWYHASDISCAQFYVGMDKECCPPWKLCSRIPFNANLRLFFNRYPSEAQLNDGGPGFARWARTASTGKKFKADVAREMFQAIDDESAFHFSAGGVYGVLLQAARMIACIFPITQVCCDFLGEAPALRKMSSMKDCAYSINLVSYTAPTQKDQLHPDNDEKETSMREVYDAILSVAGAGRAGTAMAPGGLGSHNATSGPLEYFTQEPTGRAHFNIINGPGPLLDRSGVGLPIVNVQARYLTPGEQVMDALPYQDHMGWLQFLLTLCNCCFMCPPKLNAAMILTNQRIISVYIDGRAAARGDGTKKTSCSGSYQTVVESFTLGDKGFQEGLMALSKTDAGLLVRTKFGGLDIRPMLLNRYPFQCSVSTRIRARSLDFLSRFVSSTSKQVLAAPPAGFNAGVPEALQHVVPLIAGEQFIATMRSEGLFLNLDRYKSVSTVALSCCDRGALARVVRCCTCGCRPFEQTAHVILTTHRLIGVGFPENNPLCLAYCCGQKQLAVYWQPLANLDGWEVHGGVNIAETCATRCCGCLPCFAPANADMALNIAGVRGFPVPIQRFLSSSSHGILEEAQVSVLRRALSLTTAAPGMPASVDPTRLPGKLPTAPVAAAGTSGY